MRNDAKTRKHRDINFRLRKKPKQSLPERRQGIGRDVRGLRRKETCRGKEMSVEKSVGKQTRASGEQNAENEHSQNGIDEPGPNSQRQPRQRHSLRTQINCGRGKVNRAAKRRREENAYADNPNGDSVLRGCQECPGQDRKSTR